ncbi:hypothetical protein BK784_08815 [Bacillus thuringiensis serovar medellin]|uniref:Helix-turn-helix domain-containing protein n=1 Tax=Bacillus thuringiensis subsp. medellin TaxID=79672 RepID=A0A9X6N7B8_BACTV|nr:helix-turn-helix domain-containing protein [Bacillus thuringiensis]OUC02587.1 hypothetical protein BK784_08815 [Bacillus thuringiensis serovar medellin]
MKFTINSVAKKLNLSGAQVSSLCKKKVFPNCEKIKGKWLIPEQDIVNYQKNLMCPNGYVFMNEATKILNLSETRVKDFIGAGILQGEKQHRKWLILKEDVLRLKEQRTKKEGINSNSDYLTVKEASRLFKVGIGKIYRWIHNKNIKDVTKEKGNWVVSKKELEEWMNKKVKIRKNRELPKGYVDIANAVKKYSKSTGQIARLIKSGQISSARKFNGKYIFLESELVTFLQSTDDYLTTREVAKEINKSISQVSWLIKKGYLENAQKINKGYMIPKESLKKYKERIGDLERLLTSAEIAKRLDISRNQVLKLIRDGELIPEKKIHTSWLVTEKELKRYKDSMVNLEEYLTLEETVQELAMSKGRMFRLIAEDKKFSGAMKYKEKWYIPKKSVEEYKNFLSIETPEQLFIYEYHRFSIPDKLKKTLEIFYEFTITKLNAMRQERRMKKIAANKHIKIAHLLLLLLPKDLFLLSDEEVKRLLNDDILIKGDIDLIVKFIQYCEGVIDCTFSNDYVVTKKRIVTQEVYKPEEFYEFYLFVKNVDIHLKKAIENRKYGVMWVFVLMHFIDAWRSTDILTKIPYIPIEIVECTSFEDVEQFSFERAQLLVNSVFTNIEKMTVSKTGALGQFLVHGDMVMPTAIALAIVEIHRRRENDDLLLRLYKTSNNTKIDREMHIVPFFGDREDLYHFQSRKMNRSLLTYFYYSVVEGKKNADIAYELAQRLRAHQDLDSTATYIVATNKDGSVERVSLNIVNRGHFGWLYNLIVEKFFDSDHEQSLEERTKYIQTLRKEYTPMQLERLSHFLNERLKERESIAMRVAKMPKEELKQILGKISRGEMPAKMQHAQCLTYPNCAYQAAVSCLHCEHIIPKTYLLISIDEEIKRIIKSIQDARYSASIIRDYNFLLKLLELLSQAVMEFGKDYVKTFIDLNKVQVSLLHITSKIKQIGEG